MFRSVNDFINSFKACIMINFSLDEPCSIQEKHAQLITEIRASEASAKEKEICRQNVESAYEIVKQDLLGREEEEWELK